MASIDLRILTHIARFKPELWDLIAPHGPAAGPFPDPWHLSSRFELGASMLAGLVGSAIRDSGRDIGRFRELISSDIDDWCLTGWPKWWPKRPNPLGPFPDPRELAFDQHLALLGAAIVAQQVADAYAHSPEMQDVLNEAAAKLSSAVSELG